MKNTFKNNAYHILGLDSSSNESEIFKRSKEIINRIKVDDIFVSDLDIDFFEDYRTEDSVKNATQRLQASKKKIQEYFFWFQISDNIDEEAMSLIRDKDYLAAIELWINSSGGQTTKSLFYKKNLAILYCLLLSKEDNEEYLEKSLQLWNELVSSEKFWGSFIKVYKLHDEQTASEDHILDFKKDVTKCISDIYTELYKIHDNKDYIKDFNNIFSGQNVNAEKTLLEPAFQEINKAINELEKMDISQDNAFDDKEAKSLKSLISKVQKELNKLIDLGLYNDSQTKTMRDRAAGAIRKISIELNNDLNETAVAHGLITIADQISGTDSFKSKIQEDLRVIKNNHDYKINGDKFKTILDPIIEDFKNGKSDKALETINGYLYRDNTDSQLKKDLQEIKTVIEERIVKYGKPVKSGPVMFCLNGCGTRVYGDTLYFVLIFIPILPLARYNVTHNPDGTYLFHGKLSLLDYQRYWLIGGVIGIIILLIAANS